MYRIERRFGGSPSEASASWGNRTAPRPKKTTAAPAVPHPATAIYRGAAECPRRVPAVVGEVGPDLHTEAHRAFFRQCPRVSANAPQVSGNGPRFRIECPRVSARVRQHSTHSPHILHEFHRGNWGRYTAVTEETRPLRPTGKRLARLSVVVAVQAMRVPGLMPFKEALCFRLRVEV